MKKVQCSPQYLLSNWQSLFPKAYWHWHKRSVCVSEGPALQQAKAGQLCQPACHFSVCWHTDGGILNGSFWYSTFSYRGLHRRDRKECFYRCVSVCVHSHVWWSYMCDMMLTYICVYYMPLFFRWGYRREVLKNSKQTKILYTLSYT